MNICARCKKEFDPNMSKYLCGYGKCETCCGYCMHRNYPNPNYKPVPEKHTGHTAHETWVNQNNKNTLDGFFGSLKK